MAVTTYPGTVTPLRGLDSFTEAERDVFWGRERERDELTRLVTGESYRAGLLHGPAGAGKTSLLRAGLIPHLRDHGVVALLCRDNSAPAASLAAELAAVTNQAHDEADHPVAFLGRVAASALRGQQFLFILDDIDVALMSRDDTIIGEIADLFARVVTRSSGRARFLFCCESEQLHTFGILERRTGSLFPPSSRIRLEPMTPDEAADVLDRMLSLSSISGDSRLARYLAKELGRGMPVLPTDLQIAAMAMRDLSLSSAAAIDELGGPPELPKAWLSAAASSTGDERAALRLLAAMAQGRGKAQVTPSWVGAAANVDPQFAATALEQLATRGVVSAVAVGDSGERRYRLAHEILAPRVRELAAPARAAARRAFELLGSKAAEGGRLSLREWFEVRRQSLEPASDEEREVLERTRRFGYIAAGLAVGLPLLFLAVIYFTMSGRYYLDAATVDGTERAVVRDGRPGLSMFNWLGFGGVVADTGFSRQMFADGSWGEVAAEDITFGGGAAANEALEALDPATRSLLVYAAEGSESALDGLRQGADRPEELAELLEVLAAIGRGGPKEIELIDQTLEDGSPAVRIAALRLAAAVERRRPNTYRAILAGALASKRADQRRLAAAVVRGLPPELEGQLWSRALDQAKGPAREEILARRFARPSSEVDPADLAAVIANPEAEKSSRASARARLYRMLAVRPAAAAPAVAAIAVDDAAPEDERVAALDELRRSVTDEESLGKLRDTLSKLTLVKSEAVKAAALPLLARLDPEAVAGDLAIMTENKALSPVLRAAVALSWGEVAKVKRAEAQVALEQFLEDRTSAVREAAARAYGKLGRVSQGTLSKMVKTERSDVAVGAAFGLVASAGAGGSPNSAVYGINQLWKQKGRAKLQAAAAYSELARSKPGSVHSQLASAARDKDDSRLHAVGVEGLCNAIAAGYGKATRSLLGVVGDGSADIRQQIAECASDQIATRPAASLELAARLLGDSSATIRLEATQVLAALAAREKREGVDEIGQLLGRALLDSSRAVRVVAAGALADLGAAAPAQVGEKLPEIFGRADEEEKLALLAAARAVGATDLVPLASGDPSERVRIAGLALAFIDKKVAQASLEAALTDASAAVRLAALDAMVEARDRLGLGVVERALGLAARDRDERIAARALALLARVGEPKAVTERLERLLDSRSDGDRERAAAAAAGLADTGADDAIRLLEPRLRDSARDVRAAAALSLGRVLASQQSIDELAAGLRRAEKEPARRLALAAALVVKAGNEPEPVLAALAAIGEDGPPLGALMARVTHGLISSSADAFTFFRWMAP